jgi:hypothetical protein
MKRGEQHSTAWPAPVSCGRFSSATTRWGLVAMLVASAACERIEIEHASLNPSGQYTARIYWIHGGGAAGSPFCTGRCKAKW